MWWLIVFILCVYLAYVKLYKPHQYWKERNVLFLKPAPIVGNVANIVFHMKPQHESMQEQYNTYNARYWGTYVFLKPAFFIKDIDLIKQLFVKAFDHFIDRNLVISEETEPVFGRGLFFLRGQRWRDMRATLSPAFTSSKMKSMYNLILECAENITNHFAETIEPNEIKTVEMKDVTTRYANDVIASCAFGIKCDSLNDPKNEFYQMGGQLFPFKGWRAMILILSLFLPSVMNIFKIPVLPPKVQNYFRNLVSQMMDNREKHGIVRPDMIHLLMEAKKGNLKYEEIQNSGAGFATVEESTVGQKQDKKHILTDDDLTAQVVLFFAAGFDTTSTLLSFMAYELALNEDVQRKLQEEIDIAMEDNNNKLSYETILNMKYLDMVVCETLRKWPPVPALDRLCVKPYTVEPTEPNESPVLLEKGMLIWIGVYSMHHDPKYFPEPERFDPERFSEENKSNIVPYSYLPFGIGPRNCIGSRFALLEAKAMYAYLLSKFDIVVVEKTQIPIQIDKHSFNMHSSKGFWLGLKLRQK